MGTTANPIARYERPDSRCAGKMGRFSGAARRRRSTIWPAEVSSGGRGVLTSHRTLKGSRAFGLPIDAVARSRL